MPTAAVFAYHDVGVRCLSVLLARGVRVPLVVTHEDDPAEPRWFASVAQLAREHGIPVATPARPEGAMPPLAAAAPDFVFSFYYRRMVPAPMLRLARRGAYNMHGSLLPRFRGRAPINWAILRGATETGATLHAMVEKPDAGDIVDQLAVPILPDDLAIDVFRKVTVAAELVLDRSLAALLAGRAPHTPQDLAQGEYCGGRRPEDGRIDWSRPAREIHDLVRAVAPPFPGAFGAIEAGVLRVLRTRSPQPGRSSRPALRVEGAQLLADCADGSTLPILEAELDGVPFDAAAFIQRFGARALPLTP